MRRTNNGNQNKLASRRMAPAFVGAGVLAAIAGSVGVGAFAAGVKNAGSARQTNIDRQLATMRTMLEFSLQQLRDAEQRLEDVERRDAFSPADAADQIAKSVFMLGAMDDDGDFDLVGTGFVVRMLDQSTILATNAHVADGLRRAQERGLRIVARKPGDAPEDFAVTGAPSTHPGYEGWWSISSRNIHMSAAEGLRRLDMLSPADVALVTVDGKLGPTLPLATTADLSAFRPGDELIYVGFPAENLVGQHVNTPAIRGFGRLLKTSGFVFEPAATAEATYLYHDIELTGGSSGGPLVAFNSATGALRVVGVHSASSYIFTENARVPVGGGYGQGIHFLNELLDNSAVRAQSTRDVEWVKALNAYTAPLADRLDAVATALSAELGYDPALVGTLTIDGDRFSAGQAVTRGWHVTTDADYLIVAAGLNWDDVDLHIRQFGEELGSDYRADGIAWVQLAGHVEGEIQIDVSAPTVYADTEIELRIYRLH